MRASTAVSSLLRRGSARSSYIGAPRLRMSSLVTTEKDSSSGIAVVSLNRPPANAFNLPFMKEIIATVKDCEADSAVQGIVVATAHKSIFSAGLDLTEFYQKDRSHVVEFWKTVQDMWHTFYTTGMPVASCISGHCPAGGLIIASGSDYRVMQRGKFTTGLNEVKFGIIAPFFLVDSFTNCTGYRNAELAVMLGKLYSPEEALKFGIVDELADSKEAAMTRCKEIVGELLQTHPEARAMTKTLMRQPTIDKFNRRREADVEEVVSLLTAEKTQKNLGAYLASLSKKKK